MNARRTIGTLSAAAAVLSLLLNLFGWLGHALFFKEFEFLMAGMLLVFASGAVSAHYLKPYYKVDRVLQITRLQPFFSNAEYKSLWVAFCFAIVLFLVGFTQAISGHQVLDGVIRAFSGVWFGFFYVDAMILLRAKFPNLA
jgi:hypothetical protein